MTSADAVATRWVATSDERARLFVRETGIADGVVVVVVHGGPDFDHAYLAPELDRLGQLFRVVYYDQRGRGRSSVGVVPEHVSLTSEVEDLDCVRRSLGVDQAVILGHSWGCVIAMEYAIRHTDRVAALILVNTAPASAAASAQATASISASRSDESNAAIEKLRARDDFRGGDLEADAAYHHLHFAGALASPGAVDDLVARLRVNVDADGIVLARAIESRLYAETWRSPDFDLIPRLRGLQCPTMVIHGDRDLFPIDVASAIADAIPGAEFEVIDDCGHFTFIEQFDQFRESLITFLAR